MGDIPHNKRLSSYVVDQFRVRLDEQGNKLHT